MGVDPVGQRLRPGRFGKGEARGPKHGDEDLRHADFAREAVDDDRHAVAGVVDEQPLAGGVRLAHRHRQRLLEGSIELAEPRVAVAARIGGAIFVPQDQQGDVLALQFAMYGGPIRLGDPPVAALAASAGVERPLQRRVVHIVRQWPGEACGLRPPQRLPHRRAGHAEPAADLVRRYAGKLQPNNLARIAHPNPLRWHRSSFGVAKGATYSGQRRRPPIPE
jgi:hypothetical protein